MLEILEERGLNARRLRYRDFKEICQQLGILIFHTPEPSIVGVCLQRKNRRIIVLNENLRGRKKTYIAFHELAHHLLDHDGSEPRFFRAGLFDTEEEEAEVVAFCAILPRSELLAHTDKELIRRGFCHWGVSERRRIYNSFKI